jgi:transposase
LQQVAKEVGVDLRGAYLNLDGGFDSARNRKCIFNLAIPHSLLRGYRLKGRVWETVVSHHEKIFLLIPHSLLRGGFIAGLIPNIPENRRNRKRAKRGRKRFLNAAIHALRMRIERTFAWEDKFKRLLLRFERIQQRHYGMKLLVYTLINLRAFWGA